MISYSNYLKSYIRLVNFITDEDWTFVLCDEKGQVKLLNRVPIKARVRFSFFEWKVLKSKKEE